MRKSFLITASRDASGKTFRFNIGAHALVVATGVSYRKLDIPGIDKLTGAGVYYGAAMTEALLCAEDDVYIVGGANSAGQAAMYFAKYASRVIMLVRGASLSASMSKYLIDQIGETPTIELRPFTEVTAVQGDSHLEAITLTSNQSGDAETVPARALTTRWPGGGRC